MQTHLAVRRERCRSQLVRQTDLEGRAHWLQRRLHTLHIASQQLPGLRDQETSNTPFPAAVEPCEMAMCNKVALLTFCPSDSEAMASSSSSDDGDDLDMDEGRALDRQ